MKPQALLVAATVSLSACASVPGQTVEHGYDRGALGVAAIERQDWDTAEQKLMALRGVGANDPARLINLGKVYLETGRPGMALSAWRLALASDDHFMVETIGGNWVSTRELARRAIRRHEGATQSATR